MFLLGPLLALTLAWIALFIHEAVHAIACITVAGKPTQFRVGEPKIWNFRWSRIDFVLGPIPTSGGVGPPMMDHLKNWMLRYALVCIAAPIANLAIATAIYGSLQVDFAERWGFFYPIFLVLKDSLQMGPDSLRIPMLTMFADLNLLMAANGFLVLPGLDGANFLKSIVGHFFPNEEKHKIHRITLIGPFLLASFCFFAWRMVAELFMIIKLW